MTRALVSAVALLIGMALLVNALERVAMGPGQDGRAGGSRPVPLEWCPKTPCFVP